MNDVTLVSHLKSMAAPSLQPPSQNNGSGSFLETIKEAIDKTNDKQLSADQAVQDVSTGKSSNIHQMMIAVEEADISMRLMVQMRNKVMDAYKAIMDMQV